MSESLNSFPLQHILYYCRVVCKADKLHNPDCSEVCVVTYKDGNLDIVCWICKDCKEPSLEELMELDRDTVLDWYRSNYEEPAEIAAAQLYKISSERLKALKTDESMIGYMVYNTSEKMMQVFNGTDWVDCFPR